MERLLRLHDGAALLGLLRDNGVGGDRAAYVFARRARAIRVTADDEGHAAVAAFLADLRRVAWAVRLELALVRQPRGAPPATAARLLSAEGAGPPALRVSVRGLQTQRRVVIAQSRAADVLARLSLRPVLSRDRQTVTVEMDGALARPRHADATLRQAHTLPLEQWYAIPWPPLPGDDAGDRRVLLVRATARDLVARE